MKAALQAVGTVVLAVTGALVTGACGHGSGPADGVPGQAQAAAPARPAPPVLAPGGTDAPRATVAEALAAPVGTALTVEGQFAGWSGGCAGAPPASRSDWMVVDAGGRCLYVSGPLPVGITPPPDTRSQGTPVSVRGHVQAADDGRRYLRRGR